MPLNLPSTLSRPSFRQLGDGKGRGHLIGIAGAGMQALSEVLLGRGWRLTGSDLAPDQATWLSAAGVRVFCGHDADHVPRDADVVVYSQAVPPDNPERRRAAELGLAERSYPQMLAALSGDGRGLAVAGTHGKSTVAAMAAEILVQAGLDPTVIAGGTALGRKSGGRAGRSDLVLVEACEYRAGFLGLSPQIAAVLGIEPDHFDCYRSRAELETAFAQFVRRVPNHGLVLAFAGCPATLRAIRNIRCRAETFGLDAGADWRAGGVRGCRGRYTFQILHRGRRFGEVELRVPGRHHVSNALAAAAMASQYGASTSDVRLALGRFAGLRRRLEIVGDCRGVVLLDDYAHHPTQVAATLATVREQYPGRRLWCIFQPHQASRTRHLLDEFAASLQNADRIVIAEIFRAREASDRPAEVTAADLAERVRARGACAWNVPGTQDILEQVHWASAPGDVVITLGAGDIRKVCDGLAERFRTHRAAG